MRRGESSEARSFLSYRDKGCERRSARTQTYISLAKNARRAKGKGGQAKKSDGFECQIELGHSRRRGVSRPQALDRDAKWIYAYDASPSRLLVYTVTRDEGWLGRYIAFNEGIGYRLTGKR